MLYSCIIGRTLKTIHALLANLWGANIHAILELSVHKTLTVHCDKSGINHHIHTMLKLYRYIDANASFVTENTVDPGPLRGLEGPWANTKGGPRATERIGGTLGKYEKWTQGH